MRLMNRMLFLIFAVVCIMHNAMGDCTSGKTTLKDGRQFVDAVSLSKCESVGALISDKKANTFKLSCVKTKFKCIAKTCPNNLTPDKNGICSTVNASEQSRFHKNLLTHTYQKRHFFDACASLTASENQNKTVTETKDIIPDLNRKIKYACITDFANYKLSTALAIGLIERYNWSNGIGQIRANNCTTQQNNRFISGGGRSIRCLADNGIYVEFLFGKMDSLSTSREDVAGAVCPVFGFQHLDSKGNQHRCHGKKSFKDMAAFIRQNELMDIKNVENGYFEILPLRNDITKKDDLSKILDTDEFKSIVTYPTAHIKVLLKKYISNRLKSNGYSIESIKFYSARSNAFYTADGSVWPIEILACKKNDCKSYIKLFKFRSLFGSPGADLHFASWTSLSVEQMACLMKDGLFDSKHCFFLEEDINNEKKQCAALNSLIQSTFAKPSNTAKAEFDTENNMCVLNSSSNNAQTLKNLGIAAQVGLLLVTTIATAGAGTALGIGLAAGGLLADGVTLWADIEINKSSMKFLKLSSRCYNATCAKKYFEEEFEHMLRLMDRINDDEFKVIDAEMDRLVKLLDDKYLNDKYATELAAMKDKTTGFFNNMSTEETIETVATVVSLALSLGSATKGVKALIAKSKKVEPKFMKTLATRLNKMKATAKAKNIANKTDDVADAEQTVASARTDVSAIKRKIYSDFDEKVMKVKNGEVPEFYIVKTDKLSDEELEVLEESLRKEGLELNKQNDALFSVKKSSGSDINTTQSPNQIINASTQLDKDRAYIVERLKDITGSNWWEYKSAKESGLSQGVYRVNLRTMGGEFSEETVALRNKLNHANVKFEFSKGNGYDAYLVIREENIGEVGKIKPISVVMEDAKKTGPGFIGKLKGWKVDKLEQITDKSRNSVFKFTEKNSGKTYYLKHTPNTDEITRTKRAYEILNGKSNIVHTVKVIEDDQDVLIDFAAKNNLLKSTGEYWVLLEEVPTSKAPWSLLKDKNSLTTILRGKPITIAEQNEIANAIKKLNNGGIMHGDLEHNMFFLREPNGKLRVDIIDFEKDDLLDTMNDLEWFKKTFKALKDAGLAE